MKTDDVIAARIKAALGEQAFNLIVLSAQLEAAQKQLADKGGHNKVDLEQPPE